MMNISKSLIKIVRPNMTNKVTNLINTSVKSFASKKKDGSGSSDIEVDKKKKSVPSASVEATAESVEATIEPVVEAKVETPKATSGKDDSGVVVIESIEGHRVN